MSTMLNQLFGGAKNTGDIEFWHGAERTGWLMKQGELVNLQGVASLHLQEQAEYVQDTVGCHDCRYGRDLVDGSACRGIH